MKAVLSTTLLLTALSSTIYAQQNVRDSISKELNTRNTIDSSYVDLLNELSFEYLKSDPPNALLFINRAIQLADSLDYQKGLIRATSNKGSSFWVSGLQDEALSYYLLAISYGADRFTADFARINNNIGEVFKKKQLYDSSLRYYEKAVEAHLLKQDRYPSIIASNIAEAYLLKSNLDSAEFYYEKTRDFAQIDKNNRGLAYALFGLAEVNYLRGNRVTAFQFQRESLKLRELIDDKRGVVQSFLKLGSYHLQEDNQDSCQFYLTAATQLSREIQAYDLLSDAYYSGHEFYRSRGMYRQAMESLNDYQELRDSLRVAEFSSSVDRIKSALTAEINQAENLLLREQQTLEAQKTRSLIVTIIIVVILIFIIIAFVYQYRERLKLERHEREKEKLIARLVAKNASLKEFNSVISHNLREPLTQIIGFVDFDRQQNVQSSDLLDKISNASEKIDQTIRELSTVLNEQEVDKAKYKDVGLRSFFRNLGKSFKVDIENCDPKVQYNFEDDFHFRTYKPFLHDIFYHLFSNAFKFRDPKRQLEVTVFVHVHDKHVVFEFTDNGIGMNMEFTKNKIFKMYQRFNKEIEGRGIGLYIVKNRVEALDGHITVDSKKGKGTTFTFQLPIN